MQVVNISVVKRMLNKKIWLLLNTLIILASLMITIFIISVVIIFDGDGMVLKSYKVIFIIYIVILLCKTIL